MSVAAIDPGRMDWAQQQPPPARRGRAGVQIPLDLDDGAAEVWPAFTSNLSTDGAFVATRRSLWVGDLVTLRFAFPGYRVPVVVRAEVRWIRPAAQGDRQPPGAGVRFVNPSIAAAASIEALLQAHGAR
jgi:uncharacterized protein (TIGR02266 family)